MFFVMYPSKNTSLEIAAVCGPKDVGGLRRLQCNKFTYLYTHFLVLFSKLELKKDGTR